MASSFQPSLPRLVSAFFTSNYAFQSSSLVTFRSSQAHVLHLDLAELDQCLGTLAVIQLLQ